MVSSSSSSTSSYYDVFPSFSGEDVRRTFLSHIHAFFEGKTIKTFKDQKIQRGQTIDPVLIQAIRESKISIVILSKNYASSSWCLNELLEIMICRETVGRKVMTIFYEVDPSDVRKQTGDFGKAFEKTCVGKTDEEKQRWRKALTDVANIAGEDSQKWDNEAQMIEKLAMDVLNELHYSTVSKDFDGLVGIEAHMRKLESLLYVNSEEVRMIGIWGPAGIGKTTIARALYNRFSSDFQLGCFMAYIGRRFKRTTHLDDDDYSFRLHLQREFLSEILGEKSLKLRVYHSRVVEERLWNQRVFIVLDGVDEQEQLKALADKTQWFGPKSRIIVTTRNKDLLNRYGIHHYIYEVNLPSEDEALQIFCQYAFEQNSPPDGFQELAKAVEASACHRLPLSLEVLGSSLQGKSKDEWELIFPRLKNNLDGKIEKALRFGYDSLCEKDQAIFRHIACMLNDAFIDNVKSLLDDSGLDIDVGILGLATNSLIRIERDRYITMHELMAQMGREIVRKQPIKEREFLVDSKDIEDLLSYNPEIVRVLGISLDYNYWEDELFISDDTFKRMTNLRFLKLAFRSNRKFLPHGGRLNYLPEKLRLLHWDHYPMKSLPSGFSTRYLVELRLVDSKIEKLWKGTKPLGRLKIMCLGGCRNLKEIPDLSTATNLEILDLALCVNLVRLPSSIQNLNKLKLLNMPCCSKLEVLPTNINLESLEELDLGGCKRLRCFPEIARNVRRLYLWRTGIKEVPSSIVLWPHLTILDMSHCNNLKTFPCVPNSVEILDLVCCKKLKKISYKIFMLENLKRLDLSGCSSLLDFSPSLESPKTSTLQVDGYESIEKMSCSINNLWMGLSLETELIERRSATTHRAIS